MERSFLTTRPDPENFSDQAIHERLLLRCGELLEDLRRGWRESSPEENVAMTWVGEEITDDQGRPINDRVLFVLPEKREEWTAALAQLVERTEAFGLLIVERSPERLQVLFESPRGTRLWRLKKERHGDATVLSRPAVFDNVETTGLLWNTSQQA